MRHYPRFRRPYLLAACLLPVIALTQCKPKDAPGSAGQNAAAGDSASAEKSQIPFADRAAQLGGISMLPKETEFYVGSVELKKHLQAAQSSNWWKDLNALIDDKTPAADTSDKELQAFKSLWGDDLFIAGGAGFAQGIQLMKDLNRFYNEFNFRIIMSGAAKGLKEGKTPAMSGPGAFMLPLLQDPALIERGVAMLKHVEAFPMMLGIKTNDAQSKLDQLMSAKVIEKMEKNKITVSEQKTEKGHLVKSALIDMAVILDDATVKKFLESLPVDLPPETKSSLESMIETLRTKKMQMAWGVVKDQIIFATGKNLKHLNFVDDPAESLLAHPAFANIASHADKNLLSLLFTTKETLLALHDDQPIQPMLKGAVSAMKENSVFAGAGEVLSKQLEELAPIESAAFGREAQDGVAALWWDDGLKGESIGGLDPKFYQSGKPLRYASLLDASKVLFGITYHGDPTYAKEVRNWFEKIFSIFYIGAKELVKTGVAGAQGQQQVAFFDMLILPTLQKIYQAEKDLTEKGLGNEVAFLLDLEGKGEGIPGGLQESLPRLLAVSEVKNRGEIANSWKNINDTLMGVAAMVGANAGGSSGPSIPEAISSENHGFTTWEYDFDIFSGDLSPNSTISDQHLILSTSKPAALNVASMLNSQTAPPTVEGCIWKADVGLFTEMIQMILEVAPKKDAEQEANVKQALNFLKPFKSIKGHAFEEDGLWKNRFEWEIIDPASFD